MVGRLKRVHPNRFLSQYSRLCADITIGVGCCVLLGWVYDVVWLKSILAQLPDMKPNTALAFCLAGMSLRLAERPSVTASRAGMTLAVVVFGIGLMSVFAWVNHSHPAINQLLVPGVLPGAIPPRMSLASATSLVLLAVALCYLHARGAVAASAGQSLAIAVNLIASLEALGYLFDAAALFQVGVFNGVALHTTLTFLLISTGVLCARPAQGWFRHLAADTASARMGRRLMLSIYLLLPCIAWLRLRGQQVEWYGTQFGIDLLVCSNLLVVGTLVWLTTRAANAAEERIRYLNRIYAMLSSVNALIVRATDRQVLFQELCEIAVNTGEFAGAWLGVIDAVGSRVRPVASAGKTGDLSEGNSQRLSLVSSDGWQSALARAVQTKQPIAINELNSEVDMYVQEFTGRGVHSVAVLPLLSRDAPWGIFKLHARAPRFFNAQEMRLLKEMAGDIAFAVEHLQAEETLHYLAYFDSLTGLANSSLLRDRVRQHLTVARQSQRRLALLILDVRRFKLINDTYGRDVADAVLKQIAERLDSATANTDAIARTGPNQFAAILPRVTTETELVQSSERLLSECFEMPFAVADGSIRLSAQAGVSLYPEDGADELSLMSNAEEALKHARSSGDTLTFYRGAVDGRVAELLQFEIQLRGALERGEFVLHYQPKVDACTRSIEGFEALLRWQSPQYGLVMPDRFIALLEELGLIREVGAWVLQQACQDAPELSRGRTGQLRIAVNVSAIQLRQPDFVEMITARLGTGEPHLEIEITESVAMTNVADNIGKLRSLRALGVRVAIDDFGTGYSSLAYLAKLPADYLKIDRMFVMGLPHDKESLTLVSSLITLAHSLNIQVTAEGVETEGQARILAELGCDQLQGYLFGRAQLVEYYDRPVPEAHSLNLATVRQSP